MYHVFVFSYHARSFVCIVTYATKNEAEIETKHQNAMMPSSRAYFVKY